MGFKCLTAKPQTLLVLCAVVAYTSGSSLRQSVTLLQFSYSQHWPATRTLFEAGYVSALGLPSNNAELNFTIHTDARPIARDSPANQLRRALSYGMALVNTSYGWWSGGQIPISAPAWAKQAPAPTVQAVRDASVFCAGVPNLMLRLLGRSVPCVLNDFCGGTGAYTYNYSSVATPFNITASYPAGTLVGMPYVNVSNQGHVGVLLGEGPDAPLLHSFTWCQVEPCAIVTPGVQMNYTLKQAYYDFPGFCNFSYAILPEHWLLTDAPSVGTEVVFTLEGLPPLVAAAASRAIELVSDSSILAKSLAAAALLVPNHNFVTAAYPVIGRI